MQPLGLIPILQLRSFASTTPSAQLLYQLTLHRSTSTQLDLDWKRLDVFSNSWSHTSELLSPSIDIAELALAGLPDLKFLKLGLHYDQAPSSGIGRLLTCTTGLTALQTLAVMECVKTLRCAGKC